MKTLKSGALTVAFLAIAAAHPAAAKIDECGDAREHLVATEETADEIVYVCECNAGYVRVVDGGQCVRIDQARLVAKGDVSLILHDGRILKGKDARREMLTSISRVTTGKKSSVIIRVPSEWQIALGSDTNLVFEKIEYAPDGKIAEMTAKLERGFLKWKTLAKKGYHGSRYNVRTDYLNGGVRGTEFESAVFADRSGYVKLRKGELEISDAQERVLFTMRAGQMITIDSTGNITGPVPIQ
jgi:hypothetical protein